MTDLSGISGAQKLTSKPKVSLESIQKEPSVQASSGAKEIEKFEMKMEQIDRAFALVQEIRHTLESALHDLSPSE